MKRGLIAQIKSSQQFFKKTLECFDEEDSTFAPNPAVYTVAAHVAHCGQTIEWFIEGAFGKGWDMDFETHVAESKGEASLKHALARYDKAIASLIATIENTPEDALFEPIPDKKIMEGAPRMAIVSAITDHTAHHRGALAVYARLIGKEPAMPYG